MSFPDKTDDNFHSEIRFENNKCFLTLSGKFDWTEGLFEKCFNQVLEYNDIKHLEVDCCNLISSTNQKGSIDSAFTSSLEALRIAVRKRRIRLKVRFKSPKQVIFLINMTSVEGKPILKSLKRCLAFDNPD